MLRNNIIANFLGQVWPSLLGILLVPVYLRYLGVEAYGLVGFFVSLQALISFLDLGLSTTTNREVALGSDLSAQRERIRNLLRTLELIYGAVSLIIALGFFLSSNWLASNWIRSNELPLETIRLAVIIFGIRLAFRWPVSLYKGVLQGSERQVLQNTLAIIIATIQGIGSAVVIIFISPTILAYLIWQVVAAFMELFIMSWAAWRSLRLSIRHTPSVKLELIREIWKFSAAVSANSFLAALIKQLDRVFITGFLNLQQTGYYTTANTVYSAVGLVTIPIATAAFPRFTALIAEQDQKGLAEAYHRTSQYASFIAAPLSAILFFFSHEILLVWTGSVEVASNAAPVLSILSIAALFNSMMRTTFRLQLAAGITSIFLWNNILNVIFLGPCMYFLIHGFGIAGAGVAWLVFNVLYFLIVPQIMHSRLLPTEKNAWYLKDTLPFMLLGFLVFATVVFIFPSQQNLLVLLVKIILGIGAYLIVTLIFNPVIRFALISVLQFRRVVKI